MATAQGQTRPARSLRPELRPIRAEIVRGLVRLAGSEPVRARKPPEGGKSVSDEDRRSMLRQALEDLDLALAKLRRLAEGPAPEGPTPPEFLATISTASTTVRDLLVEVRGAVPKRLKEIPEAARGPLAKLLNEWCPVEKILIAVHGIGDQTQNATVQIVAQRVCAYTGQPAALPLGRFHGAGATVTGAFLPVPNRDPAVDCGFAEIYWADVPRAPVRDQHILEDPQNWARALVERLRMEAPEEPDESGKLDRQHDARRSDERLEQLLEELIQGVTIANRLVFLAEKAGLFKFNLKKLLDDYLDDVQVVTEYEDYREEMLAIFREVFEKIHRYFDSSDLYIVAHSEGTVISFMGLLGGLARGDAWAGKVRGYMTIGSPLNKHVRFWPELFNQYTPPATVPEANERIRWRNYYDYGDPIGFDLRPTRNWMKESGWSPFFEFNGPEDARAARTVAEALRQIGFVREAAKGVDPAIAGQARTLADQAETLAEAAPRQPDPDQEAERALARAVEALAKVGRPAAPPVKALPDEGHGRALQVHDYGFTRYYFPGEAHNEYWKDPEVFGHFLQEVVDPDNVVIRRDPKQKGRFGIPGTNVVAWVTSYVLPYVMAAGLMYLATDILYKAMRGYLDPIGSRFEGSGEVFFNVLGFAGLIAGMSLLARIPRLASGRTWRLVAWALSLLTFAYFLVSPANRDNIEQFLTRQTATVLSVGNAALLAAIVLGALVAWQVTVIQPVMSTLLPVVALVLVLRLASIPLAGVLPPLPQPLRWHSLALIAVSLAIGVRAWRVSWQYPQVGTKPLVHTGALLILLVVGTELASQKTVVSRQDGARIAVAAKSKAQEILAQLAEQSRNGEDPFREGKLMREAANLQSLTTLAEERGLLWPVLLAGAAFLYLWWLAILVFDLTFVWHLYIRHAGAQRYVESRIRHCHSRKCKEHLQDPRSLREPPAHS